MAEQRRWGKAGVRLTPEQANAIDARNRSAANQSAAATAENDRIARMKWAAGMVVPHMITLSLNEHSLYGPEVDRACRAQEPDVDMWEAGKLYPRWDQLVALAALTMKTPRWFTEAGPCIGVWDTSMRFHVRRDQLTTRDIPVMRYPDDVVARCPGTGLPNLEGGQHG